jgi:hypothetical protein
MRTLSSLLIAAVLAACGQPASSAPAPPTTRVGIFRFTERPPQSKAAFQGRVGVTHDTVVVEWDSGPCLYDSRSSARNLFIYHCGETTVSFERSDPVGRASYSVTTTVLDRQTTCAIYTTDSSGRQVCTRQKTETVERQVPVNGILHLEPEAKPD